MAVSAQYLQFHIFQAKIEKLYTPKVQKIFIAQVTEFNEYAKRVGFDQAQNNLHEYFKGEDFIPVINNLHKQSAGQWGFRQYREIMGSVRAAKGRSPFSPYEKISNTVVANLRLSLLKNVHGISVSARERAHDIIVEGNVNGWGYDKTAAKLAQDIGSKWRALRIVRTESVKAANMGAYEGAKATGFKMWKIWRSAHDNRVRGNPNGKYPLSQFDHWDMDGQKVPMDKNFFLGQRTGSSDELKYPGDPNGQAADIINCRCVASYEVVRDAQGAPVRVVNNPVAAPARRRAEVAV